MVCGRSRAASARAASATAVRSRARSAPSGVGAQMTAVRTRPRSAGSVVVRKPPESIRRMSAAVRPAAPVSPAVARVGVVADGVDAGGDGGLGEGQAEMAESDDGEICGHGVWPSFP